MASWVWPAMPPVRGACEVGGGEVGGGEVDGDGDGDGEVDGDGDGDDDGDGDGLFCAEGLAGGHVVDDVAVLLCPAEAPDEGALELP